MERGNLRTLLLKSAILEVLSHLSEAAFIARKQSAAFLDPVVFLMPQIDHKIRPRGDSIKMSFLCTDTVLLLCVSVVMTGY